MSDIPAPVFSPGPARRRRRNTPTVPSPPRRRRRLSEPYTRDHKRHLSLTLKDLHPVFQRCPDLEHKYLRLMRLPITGKEGICLPFEFRFHRQHTCLDLSPYGNEQVAKSACTTCKDTTHLPTAADSTVAFINQAANIMRLRRFYFGFRKNLDLVKMSALQPQVFQLYFILQAAIPDPLPVLYAEDDRLHLRVLFEDPVVHIPCECIEQILAVAKDSYRVTLDIRHQRLTITATCLRIEPTAFRIDALALHRKVDELDIPSEISEKYEQYAT